MNIYKYEYVCIHMYICRLCKYMFIYAHIYTHICVFIYLCKCIYINIYICIYIFIYVYIYIYIYIYIYVYECMSQNRLLRMMCQQSLLFSHQHRIYFISYDPPPVGKCFEEYSTSLRNLASYKLEPTCICVGVNICHYEREAKWGGGAVHSGIRNNTIRV